MQYQSVETGIFLARPNRFLAHVNLNGNTVIAHVKNTGRCRELLLPGATVYLEPSDNPNRKTKFSLIAVKKGTRLINMDSQAPNKVLEDALATTHALPGLPPITAFRREFSFGNSRLDFLLQSPTRKILVEVKGVTLEENGVALFPDAPTERGIKHIHELMQADKKEYDAAIIFVIQMKNISHFTPNKATHPAFGEALLQAKNAGVSILAYDCDVTPSSLILGSPVPVNL